jgi:hypothetical protein
VTDRRQLLQLALLAVPAFGATSAGAAPAAGGGVHDFDFFLGSWDVQHRRLRKRLAGNDDWEEFRGTTRCQSLLGGVVNLNESMAVRETGPTNGMGLRAYDAKTGLWADWYLTAANAHSLENPGVGRFEGKVGDFFSDETFEGRPIKVRGRFTSISDGLAQWEQAFSPDGGRTWETNWVMRYTRTSRA